jgi:hypothetical protein
MSSLGSNDTIEMVGTFDATPPAPAPAAPVQSVPDGVWEALQRLIENGLMAGQASAEDARTVSAYRDRVRFMAAPAAAGVPPIAAIGSILNECIERAVANGANSISMPDEYVEIAAWLAGIPSPAAPAGAPSDEREGARLPIDELEWREIVAKAMDFAWDDWAADTGTFPDDFTLHSGRRLSFKAGAWAWNVADAIRAALSAGSPAALKEEGGER